VVGGLTRSGSTAVAASSPIGARLIGSNPYAPVAARSVLRIRGTPVRPVLLVRPAIARLPFAMRGQELFEVPRANEVFRSCLKGLGCKDVDSATLGMRCNGAAVIASFRRSSEASYLRALQLRLAPSKQRGKRAAWFRSYESPFPEFCGSVRKTTYEFWKRGGEESIARVRSEIRTPKLTNDIR
jgi:hypothetical protein